MPKPYDIYARLARDYAKPRQYSGYSSGEVTAPAPADAFGGNAPMPPARPNLDPNAIVRAEGLRRMMPEQGPPMPGSEAEFRVNMGMPTADEDRRTRYAQLHRELQALPEDSLMTRAGWAVGDMGNALARGVQNYFSPRQPGYVDPTAGFAAGRGAPPMGPQIPQQMVAARPQALNAFAMAPGRTAPRDTLGDYDFVPTTNDFY